MLLQVLYDNMKSLLSTKDVTLKGSLKVHVCVIAHFLPAVHTISDFILMSLDENRLHIMLPRIEIH